MRRRSSAFVPWDAHVRTTLLPRRVFLLSKRSRLDTLALGNQAAETRIRRRRSPTNPPRARRFRAARVRRFNSPSRKSPNRWRSSPHASPLWPWPAAARPTRKRCKLSPARGVGEHPVQIDGRGTFAASNYRMLVSGGTAIVHHADLPRAVGRVRKGRNVAREPDGLEIDRGCSYACRAPHLLRDSSQLTSSTARTPPSSSAT